MTAVDHPNSNMPFIAVMQPADPDADCSQLGRPLTLLR
jgi:hypothetical protein